LVTWRINLHHERDESAHEANSFCSLIFRSENGNLSLLNTPKGESLQKDIREIRPIRPIRDGIPVLLTKVSAGWK
jgi:uncharacterized protein YbaR (Trm112 family)